MDWFLDGVIRVAGPLRIRVLGNIPGYEVVVVLGH